MQVNFVVVVFGAGPSDLDCSLSILTGFSFDINKIPFRS